MKLVLAAALLVAACSHYKEPKVGEARLAYADGVVEAPAEDPTVAILPGKPYQLPDGNGAVRVAIDWDVTLGEVWPLVRAAAAGERPIALLVADDRGRVMAIPVALPTTDSHIRMVVTGDGKACVNLPEVEEAKCVMTAQHRVDRAWTRDLVREAFKASNLHRVNVELDPSLRWNDVVRAVDAAHTCCGGAHLQVGIATY